MLNQIFTTKLNQAQGFIGTSRKPVTLLQLPKQVVTQVRTKDSDGYSSVQLAIGEKNNKPNSPQIGHLKKAKLSYQPRWYKEVRVEETDLTPGAKLSFEEIIGEGDTVSVTATSKGKGFAGTMKRHGFSGQPKTHGQSDRARAPGSIGRGTTPGRVVKGKKMAGRMGGETVTVQGLKVLNVNLENNLITVSGLVPGSKGGLVCLTITKKNPNPIKKQVEQPIEASQETVETTQTQE